MKSARTALWTSARPLIALCGIAALVVSADATAASAPAGVPIARLTLEQRLATAPDAMLVQVGARTMTLGALRAAHRAREAGVMRARAFGNVVHGKNLTAQNGTRAVSAANPSTLQMVPQPFVEPPSQYASAPADMQAFCNAAKASACLYLPPGQEVSILSDGVSDWDGMVTQAQCAQEGGTWQGMWNAYFCAFAYPSSVTTHFTPAANFKLAQSAACDASMFAYKVDTHGAVTVWINHPPAILTTGNTQVCTVSVTPGT